MRVYPLYNAGIGINNRVQPHRLKYDPETGVIALSGATNVLVDVTGELVAARGFKSVQSGQFHSLFPCGEWGLVAKDRTNDTAVYKVDVANDGSQVTLSGIVSGLSRGAYIDYARLPDGRILYTNGIDHHGMISADGSISVPWPETEWPDEDTKLIFERVPVAEHLAYNAGRVYFSIVDGQKFVLYYTEFGLLGTYNPATNGEQFPRRIIMIVPVRDGLYVSTDESIYFLTGLNPQEWSMSKVAGYPAVEWALYRGLVDPSLMGLETSVPSPVIGTVQGPALLLPGGQFINMIKENVAMPSDCSAGGAICVFDDTLIVQTQRG